MRIVEVQALSNGAHRNQSGTFSTIPQGWAVIPDDMILENFPFGEILTEENDGVLMASKWIAGEMPIVEEPEKPITETERLRADVDFIAVMTGVEL